MKCSVCGKRFMPDAEKTYLVQTTGGVLSALTSPTVYDAINCPRCGCQHKLKERLPEVPECVDGGEC